MLSDLIDLAAADASLLRTYLDQMLSAALSTCADPSFEPDVRHQCLELFLTLCEGKPALARKIPQLVERAVPVLLRMMVSEHTEVREWSENVGDVEDDDEEEASVRYGEEALERQLAAIGGNRVVPATLALLPASLQSPQWEHRAAAFRAVAVLVTGADKAVRAQLAALVQWSVAGLRDAHCCVQHAAAGAVAALCTCFGPDVQRAHHAEIVPPLIQMLDASVLPRLRSRAAKVARPSAPPLVSAVAAGPACSPIRPRVRPADYFLFPVTAAYSLHLLTEPPRAQCVVDFASECGDDEAELIEHYSDAWMGAIIALLSGGSLPQQCAAIPASLTWCIARVRIWISRG